MKKSTKAELALLAVSFLWAASYLWSDITLQELDVFTVNGLRFSIAFVVGFVVLHKYMKGICKDTIIYAAIVGVALFGVYFGCTTALLHTSISNVGFLAALSVAFTPILLFFIKKEKPSRKTVIIICIIVIGIGLLTITDEFTIAVGDIFALLCAFSYSVMVLVIDRALKNPKVNAVQLGVFQLGFMGLYSMILSVGFGTFALPTRTDVIIALIAVSVISTAFAFIVQTVVMQYTNPVRVGIIFSTEPVFAGIVAFVVAGEVLTPRAYVGAVILIACIFAMEIDFNKIKEKFKK